LTITANNDSKFYGTLKSFSGTAFSQQGLVTANGDAITAVAETSSGAVSTAPVSPPTYPIVITPSTVAGIGLSNYTISLVDGTLTVLPAPLSATGVAITAYAGAPFSGVLATFSNLDPVGTPASYTASITWGDGSSSVGTLGANPQGLFQVSGMHTYADPK